MYRVIVDFVDLQDGDKAYRAGEIYSPAVMSDERISELSGSNNKRGMPLIKEEEEKPKRGRKKK